MSFQDLSKAARQGGVGKGGQVRTPTKSEPSPSPSPSPIKGPSPAKSESSPSPSRPFLTHGGITPQNTMKVEHPQAWRQPGAGGASAAAGSPGQGQVSPVQMPTSDPEVVRGVFQMNTAVSSFKRLVNSLGTPKDTIELRQKLHKSRQYVTQLGKEISAKLKDASTRDHRAGVSTAKKLSDAKLAKDFQAVLREFEKAQHMAVEREAAYAPLDAPAAGPGAGKKPAAGAGARRSFVPSGTSTAEAMDPLLREQQRQEMLRVEGELAYTEAVIEEREQGIQEIQHQIAEVNEIFRDLAVLVKEQGVMIDDIEANIENTHAQSVQANKQLMKAAKSQKETNSFICWVMAVFAIGMFILFLVMTS